MANEVRVERNGAVLEIVLNRPGQRNAINQALIDGLLEAAETAASDDVRAVLIRGEGKSFCVGGDIKAFAEILASGPLPREFPDYLHKGIAAIHNLPKPVIAAVHGACAGAGLSFMLSCDLAMAAEGTVFTLAYSGIGLSPDGSSTHFLPRHVGRKRAMELFLNPAPFSPERALELGLINQVVAPDRLLTEARQLATILSNGPTIAYACAKKLVGMSFDNDLQTQLDLETDNVEFSGNTEDFREGVTAFVEKRAPKFRGR